MHWHDPAANIDGLNLSRNPDHAFRGTDMNQSEMDEAGVRTRRATADDLRALSIFGARLAELHVSFDDRRFVSPDPPEPVFKSEAVGTTTVSVTVALPWRGSALARLAAAAARSASALANKHFSSWLCILLCAASQVSSD